MINQFKFTAANTQYNFAPVGRCALRVNCFQQLIVLWNRYAKALAEEDRSKLGKSAVLAEESQKKVKKTKMIKIKMILVLSILSLINCAYLRYSPGVIIVNKKKLDELPLRITPDSLILIKIESQKYAKSVNSYKFANNDSLVFLKRKAYVRQLDTLMDIQLYSCDLKSIEKLLPCFKKLDTVSVVERISDKIEEHPKVVEFNKKPYMFGESGGEWLFSFEENCLIGRIYIHHENTEKFDLGNIVVHELKLGLKFKISTYDLSIQDIKEISCKNYL